MSRRATAVWMGIFLASLLALEACNRQDDCPAKESITPDGPCGSEALQCAYDLVTPAPACDGTSVTLASSCTCTSGAWACPSPVACGGGESADAAADAGDDASASD
jgi:hypothetical protein